MRGSERDQRGAAAVETALCLCFIVLPLTFAMIAYAYMLSFRQSLSQAATEGARAAAVTPAGLTTAARTTAAQAAINAAMGGLAGSLSCGANNLTCTVTIGNCAGDTSTTPAQCAVVVVSYPYRDHSLLPTMPGLGFTLPSTLTYTATAEVS